LRADDRAHLSTPSLRDSKSVSSPALSTLPPARRLPRVGVVRFFARVGELQLLGPLSLAFRDDRWGVCASAHPRPLNSMPSRDGTIREYPRDHAVDEYSPDPSAPARKRCTR